MIRIENRNAGIVDPKRILRWTVRNFEIKIEIFRVIEIEITKIEISRAIEIVILMLELIEIEIIRAIEIVSEIETAVTAVETAGTAAETAVTAIEIEILKEIPKINSVVGEMEKMTELTCNTIRKRRTRRSNPIKRRRNRKEFRVRMNRKASDALRKFHLVAAVTTLVSDCS